MQLVIRLKATAFKPAGGEQRGVFHETAMAVGAVQPQADLPGDHHRIVVGGVGIARALLDEYVPQAWTFDLGASAVDNLLSIIASSMLAVTTFSLSTVVAAYASATSTATPRATSLLLDDTVTQNMLATFIGAFIYAIVAIVLLKAGAYGPSGRFVLFVVTIVVIGLIVMMLVRWIDFLMRFGRLGNVLDRIEDKAVETMTALRKRPCLDGQLYEGDPDRKPPGTTAIEANSAGYVQFIDMEALAGIARDHGEVTVAALPGNLVSPGLTLAYVKRPRKAANWLMRSARRLSLVPGAPSTRTPGWR
jgi:uncharacterized membrane protein